MAIVFNCPHCLLEYRLSEKLAGKQAKCKNPECRKQITIPTPITVPGDDAPAPDTAVVEAAALDALADEAPKQVEVPPEQKVIPMTCSFCDHKWTEPWAKGGKNTLCPNPECRQRQKVPEPKEDVPTNWRDQKTKLPTLAKQNFEKLEGVQSAGEAQIVSGRSIKEAGVFDDQIEPRPLKDKVFIGVGVAAVVFGLIFGVWYMIGTRTEGKEHRLMADARTDFDKVATDLTPGEAGQASAILNAAAVEYALRQNKNKPEEFKEAQARFNAARRDLQNQPPGPGRNAVAAELAFTVLEFSGNDDQVKEQLRYRWQPSTEPGSLKLNERGHSIHQELLTTLQLLHGTDFDFRVSVARRLARELVKRGQQGLAAELLPLALFNEAENYEGRAAVALEIYRADKNSPLPKKVADDLKAAFAGGVKGNPFPVSAHALFSVAGTEKPPTLVTTPAARGPVSTDSTVMAFVSLWMLEGKPEAAIDLANRATAPPTQLKALALCAEWATDPGAALEECAKAAERVKLQKSTTQPSAVLLRLAQIAAAAGKDERARAFADAIADDGLKAWARGDCVRLKIAANPEQRADEAWVEVPDDAKKVRAGHAWGRLWVARQNAKLSQNRDAEKKAVAAWPPSVHPFGLAGVALGLQDR